eukprot:TRINITY_DN6739_c1_g1_i1.p1 TRINITY_DN6739_c1_g1~~TRINITY_DN6739_c1_g1_i1.p1  ORF type:complete len:368 (+),score=26.59 TRINITY_DN6739_c1_g1_i1:55-1158(+)
MGSACQKGDRDVESGGQQSKHTSIWVVHAVVFLCLGVGLGLGPLVGKIGLSNSDPIVFALVRDVISVPVLAFWAYKVESRPWLSRSMVWRVYGAGFALFVSNVFYTIGVKVSDAVISAAWGSTLPVFTVTTAILLGFEKPNAGKFIGICFAVMGATFMEVYGKPVSVGTISLLLGSVAWPLNMTAYAIYGIVAGPLADELGPLTLTCATQFFAAVFLALLHLTLVYLQLNDYVCPPDTCVRWSSSGDELFALVYYIVVYSILQYCVIAWGRQRLEASTISSYSVVHPMISALASAFLVTSGFAKNHPHLNITMPGWSLLGGLGICLGVIVVVRNSTDSATQQEQDLMSSSMSSARACDIQLREDAGM